MPARYGKSEIKNNEIASLAEFRFENTTLYQISQAEAAGSGETQGNKLKSDTVQGKGAPEW